MDPAPLAAVSGPSSTLPVPNGGVAGPVTSAPGPPGVSLTSFQKYHPFIAEGLTTTLTGGGGVTVMLAQVFWLSTIAQPVPLRALVEVKVEFAVSEVTVPLVGL